MTMNKEKRNADLARAQELVQEAKEKGWTDETRAEYNTLVAEVRAYDEQMAAEEEVRSLELREVQGEGGTENAPEAETRAFDNFIRSAVGKITEKRNASPVNMTYGANGAVIPDTIMNKIIDRVVEISPLFAAATKYAVKGDITIPKIDRTDGDITVAFAQEFSTLTANGFKFGSITLSGHLAAALVLVSKQLINNSRIDVVSVVIQKMAESIAVFIENFLLNGDSSISNSGLAGSIASGNVVSVASVAALTADNLIDLQDMIPDAYQSGAFWIMHSTIKNKVRKLKDGQGNYLLVPDFQKGTGYTLLGKPVFVTDNLPTANSASSGKNFIYYGDFSGLAVKTGESAEIQLLVEKYAEQHALGFNVWFELDSRIENTQKIAAIALS